MERFLLFAKQTFKYYFAGTTGVIINLGLLYFFTDILGIWYIVSQGIAVAIAITSSFFIHKSWTFKKEIIEERTLERYIKFIIICLTGMVMQLGLTYALVENLLFYYLHAAIISVIIAGTFTYLANRKWTFEIKF